MSKLAQSVESAVKEQKKKRGRPSKTNGKAAKTIKASKGALVPAKVETAMTKDFIAEAKHLDEEIREEITSIGRDLTSLGAKFNAFRDHGYHRALGFANFDTWVDDVAEERGMKHSQIRLGMRINKSLVGIGEGKLTNKTVSTMSLQNANLLAGVPPKARTAKLVEAAQKLTEKEFQKDFVFPIMKKLGKLHEVPRGKGIDPHRKGELAKIGPYVVSKEVADDFAYALKIAEWKATDDDKETPLLEKALHAIVQDFIGAYAADYEATLTASGAASETQASA